MNGNGQFPKVTIVTVTYNAKEHLEQTILSVLEQDYPNIEYIILDGGSTDQTVEIIKRYQDRLAYWVSEPDGGIYDAMNKGIDVATGEWINFMNAGDSFSTADTVKTVFERLDSDTDIIMGGINLFDSQNRFIKYNQVDDVSKILQQSVCYHQAVFAKTDLAREYKYNLQYKVVSDYDFRVRCYVNKYRFQALDFPVANYMLGGFSDNHFERGALEALLILQSHTNDKEIVLSSQWMSALVNKSGPYQEGNLRFSKQYNSFYDQLEAFSEKYHRILIYGYGKVGKCVEKILSDKVIGICDRNESSEMKNAKHYPLSKIKEIDFDSILICALGREKEISDYLCREFSIDTNQILTFAL